MTRLHRIFIVPALLGIVLGFTALHFGAGSASAQVDAASVTCPSGWPGPCTITLNVPLGPDSSITATMPDGSSMTVNCPDGCAAGAAFTFDASSTQTYVTPQQVYARGDCDDGYIPAQFGCSAAFVSVNPVYTSTTSFVPSYVSVAAYAPPERCNDLFWQGVRPRFDRDDLMPHEWDDFGHC